MKHPVVVSTLAVATFAALFATSAAAVPVNGGFETGDFTGWTTAGSTRVLDANPSFGTPPGGTYHARMDTGGLNQDPQLTDTALETFFSLSPGALDAFGAGLPVPRDPTEGSGIKQSITVSAGDALDFDFNFLTNDTWRDFAFYVVNNGLIFLADTQSAVNGHPLPFDRETGYTHVHHVFGAGGTFDLGFGVVDATDTTVASGLLIDNVTITAAIPEPSTIILMGLGLVGLGYAGRRKLMS